jgi:rod shape-determining protein MreC
MPGRYILLIITILCIALMLLAFFTDAVSGPLSYVANYTIVPVERGLNAIGKDFTEKVDEIRSLKNVAAENEALKKQVEELTLQKNQLIADRYELQELRDLYGLEDRFGEYDKIGARVIGKDPGNWFSVFLIDKGTRDGIEENMNVIAGDGLVGIVTEVGPDYSTVRSVIDDASNVSSMVLSTSDTVMVSGDLKLMDSGEIRFSQLSNQDSAAAVGDEIVTSNISNKFLPEITVGYISSIEMDANNLTMSGTLTPAVDFKHLDTVMVIRNLKVTSDLGGKETE